MKVLFISTSANSDDRKAWSGTVYQAFRALVRAGHDVDYLSAMRDYRQTFTDKLLCTYWLRVPGRFGKLTRMDESLYTVRVFRQTLRRFDYSPYDVIFVPTHLAIMNALPRRLKAKVVHLVDATVDSLFGYYTEFSNLWFHNYWEAHWLGRRAFRRSDLIIASSQWAADNAVRQYGVDPRRIGVVEFGANIDAADIPEIAAKNYDPRQRLRVYWSGVNWQRKGGDVALDACRHLRQRGYDMEFNITGMRELPEGAKDLPWVVNHGFLNKNNPEEYRRLIEIMAEQDIFLFPSRAECSSIALCEANAFALPCFVYDTGGTANYVEQGRNGRMLPLSATGSDFADAIEDALRNGKLPDMSRQAAQKYRSALNWEVWSEKVNRLLREIEC